MLNSEGSLKKGENKWPIRIIAAMGILNADVLLIGLIYFNIVSPFKAFLITLFISMPEIPIWYWALNRLFLSYVVPAGKEVFQNATQKGFLYWDAGSWYTKIALKVVKLFGHYGLFAISAEPLPLGRTLTIMSCVVARSRLGLIPVSLGNIVHLYGASILWSNILQ